jgi:hypothetical protein
MLLRSVYTAPVGEPHLGHGGATSTVIIEWKGC